ncbi:MAG TPA: hypothetical protein VHH73_13740, partial [Verrucomicrobiae bacterium]|nr:hypothetical protein [Verrucomicrobiae bacterium]
LDLSNPNDQRASLLPAASHPMRPGHWLLPALLATVAPATACELCAIYNATSARADFGGGFSFAVEEQFTRLGTELLFDKKIIRDTPDYLETSITHLVPSYNFSSKFGVSVNIPLVNRSYRWTDLRYHTAAPPEFVTQQASEFGLGDVALVGRGTVFARRTMKYHFVVNLLGGIKFPTGDTAHLGDELEQEEIYNQFIPPNTPHDPLAHSIASVHQHELSAGSGSYDGIFGVAVNSRWRSWFANAQAQYLLRTAGAADFQYGDELQISGGPGRYLIATESHSLSLQANAVYSTMARDTLAGKTSDRTGQTAWFLGPQVNVTWSEHFTANLGIDIPLHITANGFQAVPDYRLHGGISWRF